MVWNLVRAMSVPNFTALLFWFFLLASVISFPPFLIGRSQKWLTRLGGSVGGLLVVGLYLDIVVQNYLPSMIILDPSYALRMPGDFFWFAYELASPIYYTWDLVLLLGVPMLLARAATQLGAERAESLGGFLQSAAVVLIGIGASYHSLETFANVLNYLGAFAGLTSGVLRFLLSPKMHRTAPT